jgi:hypothetical protein
MWQIKVLYPTEPEGGKWGDRVIGGEREREREIASEGRGSVKLTFKPQNL